MGDIEQLERLGLSQNEAIVVAAMRDGDEYVHRIDFDKVLDEIRALRQQLQGAVEALEWIERFTSDRGDARMMDAGQARRLIHERVAVALDDQEG